MRYPHLNIQSDQGRPIYGWRHVGLPDGGRLIGRVKKEGINSNKGVWYTLYGKLSVCQTGPQAGQAVLQLYPKLDLLHHSPVRQGVQVPQLQLTVHRVLLLAAV